MNKFPVIAAMATALLLSRPLPAAAAEKGLVDFKLMTVDVAQKLAQAALAACRAKGYQVAVAVVDRFGNTQVLLRDRFAGAHTPETARRKAWTAVSFRSSTAELAKQTMAGSPQEEARNIPGVLMLGGGLPVNAGGAMVGGVGVSGAPMGTEDESCAAAGVDAVVADLEF